MQKLKTIFPSLFFILLNLFIFVSCVEAKEEYEITKVECTDTTVMVSVNVNNVKCDQVFIIIINGETEFDRKIMTKENNEYKLDYTFDGLLPNTLYTIKLVGVNDGQEVESTIKTTMFTTKKTEPTTTIEFKDQSFDYSGFRITPVISNLPDNAVVVFTPEDIYDAGEYQVNAEIIFDNNETLTLNAKITVNKISYPKEYVYGVLASKTYTGSQTAFDFYLIDDFDTELIYRINGEKVESMVEPGDYQVELLIKESTNYLETIHSFTFSIVNKELDIFISEYLEGYYHKDYNPTGNNNDKAIELYNPTENEIDLNGYKICVYKSGSTIPNNTINLTGKISGYGTYVVTNKYASAELLSLADETGELYFSGKHPVALFHNEVLIDLLGEIGAVYDSPMSINGIDGAFADNRLVRKTGITGNTTFTESEWIVMGNCNYDDLGFHVFSNNTRKVKIVFYKKEEILFKPC